MMDKDEELGSDSEASQTCSWRSKDRVDGKSLLMIGSGFPHALEIMENLENHKKSSMHEKNH